MGFIPKWRSLKISRLCVQECIYKVSYITSSTLAITYALLHAVNRTVKMYGETKLADCKIYAKCEVQHSLWETGSYECSCTFNLWFPISYFQFKVQTGFILLRFDRFIVN